MGINKSFSLTFPITEDISSNTFKTNVTSKDAIRSKLLLLITTDYGSLYYNRDFGTNVKKYLFEPSNSLTADNIKSDIITACNKFIKDISINTVEIIIDNDIITLGINFLYKTNNELDSISLTFNR